ncbi:transcription factor HES-5-like [Rhinophrynus dorsalis]
MAPYHNRMEDFENNIGKEIRKLRKPVIEKMRRDRINSSIEQLRMLLEKEFVKQQLPSRPEKADILEMTVSLLRQQLQGAAKAVTSSKHIFPSAKTDTEFLRINPHTVAEMNLLRDSHAARTTGETAFKPMVAQGQSSVKQPTQEYSSADIWRPW